jgi:hypothetical protein
MVTRVWLLLLPLCCGLAAPAAEAADPDLTKLKLSVEGRPVSALLAEPSGARALLVLAHGQVMDMSHSFMEGLSTALNARQIATLRFNFPYAEAKRSQLDPLPVLVATVRAAVAEGARRRGALPLLAGGKSMGGAMMVEAAAAGGLGEARGIVIFGFPLHPPGRPSALNARPLRQVKLPLLFVQGSQDALADLSLMRGVVEQIGETARLHVVQGGDHSYALPEGSTRNEEQVMQEIAVAVASFVATLRPSEGG